MAQAYEELCLLAAATGDFQAWQTWRGFATDRIVLNLADPELSPVAKEFAGLSGAEKDLARYRWLLEHAVPILTDPGQDRYQPLFAAELSQVQEQLRRAREGAVERRVYEDASLAVVSNRADLHRMVLNTVAGSYRVLHVQGTKDGPLYRYHDRTESWFEVVTFTPPRRRDLGPLRERLQGLEEAEGGDGAGQWCADPRTEPVPELYHGVPGEQAYGQTTRTLEPSRLPADVVVDAFREHFAPRAGE